MKCSLVAVSVFSLVVPAVWGQADGSFKWMFNTAGSIASSPAIGSDGTIYVGSEGKRLWAINPDRTTKWAYPPTSVVLPDTDWFDAAPAIGEDGTIYAGNFDGRLFAFNPNGTLKWPQPYATNSFIISSAAIGVDGTIYVGAGDGGLHAVNPDGSVKWIHQTGDWVDSSPAIGSDGSIYFGSWVGDVYAVNPDGSLRWTVPTGNAIQSSPALAADGTVYIGSGDSRLYAIRADGTVAWSFLTGDSVDGHPAVGPDGTIYFGSADGKFYALNPDGSPAWPAPFNVGQGVFGGATIREDGTILFGASDRRIYALNGNGTLKWSFITGDIVDATPAIGPDGTLYAPSYDNRLYALHGNTGVLIDGPWPKFRRDSANNGRAPSTAPETSPGIEASPASQTVAYGTPVTFSVSVSGTQPMEFQWLKDDIEIEGATGSAYTIAVALLADAGEYSVRVSNAVGTITSVAAVLTVDGPLAPVIGLQPRPLVVATGSRLSLWVTATGSAPLAFQWRRNGADVSGATSAFFEVAVAQSTDAAEYTVMVSNAGGSIESDVASVSVLAGGSSRLVNLSTRGFVGVGNSILIPGVSIAGSAPRRLLIRAVGPTLATFEVVGTISDPQLVLFSDSAELQSNNDWFIAGNAVDIAAVAATIGAFPLIIGSADAAALVELAPGNYTVQVSGVDGGTGVSLVEIYDVDPGGAATGRLTNISSRAEVGTGDNVLIPGFVIEGNAAKTLLIRAVGPTLSLFGVQDFLVNPVLRLFDGENEILVNEGWVLAPDPAGLAAATDAVGAFVLDGGSADAAALVVLMPGAYTAQAVGTNGATGNVLVEVYEVP